MEKFLVGRIVKAQGIKGEVKIAVAEDDVNIFRGIKSVFIENSNNEIALEKLTIRQGFIFAFLKGVKDRTEAEKLRGKNLYTNIDDVEIGENNYLVDDLIDCEIVNENGDFLATVLDIENYGATDILVILQEDREYRIPFIESVVLDVNEGNIVVDEKKFYEVRT